MNIFSDQKSEDYYEEKRPEIMKLVNPASKKILDVGCGAGVLAQELKKTNRAEVWGIEVVETAARKAAEKLDKVMLGDASKEIMNIPDKYFDTIIFADIIEHIVDPWTLLQNAISKLADDGEMILSIPNIGHWFVIKLLLNSEFHYGEYGLLDKTHLRFFTKNSAMRMFDKAGLAVIDLQRTKADFEKIPDVLLKTCGEIGINTEVLAIESDTFQYLFRVVKKTEIDKIAEAIESCNLDLKEQDYHSAFKYIQFVIEKFTNFRIEGLGNVYLEKLLNLKTEIEIMKNKVK